MAKVYLFFSAFLFLHSASGFSQNVIIELDSAKFSVSGNIGITGTGLSNAFINAYRNGEFLSKDLIRKNLKDLKTNNLLGAQQNYSAFYSSTIDTFNGKTGYFYYVGYEYNSLSEIKFKKDLFDIFFQGNEHIAGQHINLGDMKLNLISFHQIKFGLGRKLERENFKRAIFAGISINSGIKNLRTEILKGDFYTSPIGENIDFNVDMKFSRTDTSKTSNFAFNGIGTSFDFGWFIQKNKTKYLFTVNNLGFIRWNKHSHKYSKDTLYTFTGWRIDNIFNMSGEVLHGAETDTLVNEFGYAKTQESYYSLIPATVQFNIIHTIRPNFLDISATLSYKFFTVSRPYAEIKPQFYINQKLKLSPVFSWGGYGGFHFGGEMNVNFGKKYNLSVGTQIIDSWIFQEKLNGMGGFATLFVNL